MVVHKVQKDIHEVMKAFSKAKSKKDKMKVLKENDTPQLRKYLKYVFDPKVKFTVDAVPKYNTEDVPGGYGYQNMGQVLEKFYLFIEDHPKRPPISEETKVRLLTQLFESLGKKEATMLEAVVLKKSPTKFLTPNLVSAVFPGLLD